MAYGSTIHLLDEETGQEQVYRLVASEEVDTSRGWISPGSAVGQGLIGKREGDQIEIRTPNTTRRYEVIKVITLHDELAQETEEANG